MWAALLVAGVPVGVRSRCAIGSVGVAFDGGAVPGWGARGRRRQRRGEIVLAGSVWLSARPAQAKGPYLTLAVIDSFVEHWGNRRATKRDLWRAGKRPDLRRENPCPASPMLRTRRCCRRKRSA
jgi:hypothetical protein